MIKNAYHTVWPEGQQKWLVHGHDWHIDKNSFTVVTRPPPLSNYDMHMSFSIDETNHGFEIIIRDIRLEYFHTIHNGVICVLARYFLHISPGAKLVRQLYRVRPEVYMSQQEISKVRAMLILVIAAARKRADRVRAICTDFIDAAKAARLYKHALAKRIQRRWRHAISSPEHALCQRRLMREFQECVLNPI